MNLSNWKKFIISAIIVLLLLAILIIFIISFRGDKTPSNEESPIQCEDIPEEIKDPTVIVEQKDDELSEVGVDILEEDIEATEAIEVTEDTEVLNGNEENILPLPEEEVHALDRTKPLYNVYKGGYVVEVPVELQWHIRDMCETYDFYEKYVYGMILVESTFQPAASNGECIGLCQITPFWIKDAAITHFTDDYRHRDLKDPYDNLLTMTEMWCYARDTYGLDLMTEDGIMRVLYWHSSGKDPRRISKSNYADLCMKYANELVPVQ